MFVGNLSYSTTREDLKEIFAAAGKVVDVKIPTDRVTGQSRGFAFVELEDDEAAQRSIGLLNGKDVKGRAMRVSVATDRPPRSATSPPILTLNHVRDRGAAPPPMDFPIEDRRRTFKGKEKKKDEDRGIRRDVKRRKKVFDDED